MHSRFNGNVPSLGAVVPSLIQCGSAMLASSTSAMSATRAQYTLVIEARWVIKSKFVGLCVDTKRQYRQAPYTIAVYGIIICMVVISVFRKKKYGSHMRHEND